MIIGIRRYQLEKPIIVPISLVQVIILDKLIPLSKLVEPIRWDAQQKKLYKSTVGLSQARKQIA